MIVALEENRDAVFHHQLMHGQFPAGPTLLIPSRRASIVSAHS